MNDTSRKNGVGGDKTLVLAVNDHDGARFMVSLMLKKAGFDVVEAANGTDAMRVMEERNPPIVVLDVNLPDMDGYEVCRQIRANPRTSSAKILHTSGTFVALENKVASLEGGADAYLTQPFEPQELVATIRALLRLTRAEDNLKERAAELKEADRRKDEFLAMLAHELRNPLAAIVATLPLMDRRPPSDDIERRGREVLRRQAAHLSRLIDDLLDVARVTQGKIELRQDLFDLRDVLTRLVEVARPTRFDARGQTIVIALPDRPALVRADPARIEQVFMNLLDNASKYTDRGGQISVAVSIVSANDRGWVRVSVRDNGIGVAPEALPLIFNLFNQSNVTIERSRGGLGIGLTLVRSIVSLHGGTISAYSEGLGRGSEFVVDLPLATVTQVSPAEDEAPGASELKPRLRMLIVEDNEDARQSLVDLCELWGHQVASEDNGQSGVIRAQNDNFDVALVDIGLPIMNGYEVARKLRAEGRHRGLRLIALTGYGAPEERKAALDAGFDLHIVKPIDPEKLAALLNDVAATTPEERDAG